MQKRYTVKLQYATYTGEEIVYADENEDTEMIIARAWKQVRKYLTLPMAYQSAKIINVEDVDDLYN